MSGNYDFVIMDNGDLIPLKAEFGELEIRVLAHLYSDAVDVSDRGFSFEIHNGRELEIKTDKGTFEYEYFLFTEYYILFNDTKNYLPLRVKREVLDVWLEKV